MTGREVGLGSAIGIPDSIARAMLTVVDADGQPLAEAQLEGAIVESPLPATHPDSAMVIAKRPVAIRFLELVEMKRTVVHRFAEAPARRRG